MKIIGISKFTHDVGAALVEDGVVKCAIEEERFSRVRHHPGFEGNGNAPIISLNWCLKEGHLKSLREVDYIAISWEDPQNNLGLCGSLASIKLYRDSNVIHIPGAAVNEGDKEIAKHFSARYEKRKEFINSLKKQTKVEYIGHHLSHASYAYRLSPFSKSLVIVMDGKGEDVSTTVFMGYRNRLNLLRSYPISQSIGYLYSIMTRLLGLGRRGEGKTMALAAYGKPIKGATFLTYNKVKDKFVIRTDEIRRYSKYARKENDPLLQIHRDIAATLQRDFNASLERFVVGYVERTEVRTLCLSGGVALNCTLNGRLLASGIVDELFVPPAPHDGGVSLGAALELYSRFADCYKLDSKHAFTGYKSSKSEIKALLNSRRANFSEVSNLPGDMAKNILAGKIIGVAIGRGEYGPRALGNRSILADPRLDTVALTINQEVKHRETWRPFAVAILREDLPALFGSGAEAPFMNIALKATPLAKKLIPGVIHKDGTVRIQTVTAANSPYLYKVLKKIKAKTGYGIVLNTSFNDRGEPLVNTAEEAMGMFSKTEKMDTLYLENYRVEK